MRGKASVTIKNLLYTVLYMMFSKDDAPTAKLPINIPKLDDSYSFTDNILYARVFGLTYESEQEPTAEPATTVSDTTSAPTEPVTTVPDATSSTQKSATPDQAVNGNNTTGDSGAVQTGENIAIVIVIMLIGLSALLMMRYAKGRKE